jgi:hypothetical protein
MRPGRWEITTRLELLGSPFNSPTSTNVRCVTTEQARTPVDTVWMVTVSRSNPTCKNSNTKTEGNTLTWKEVCSDGVNHPTTGDGEMVFDGDSFTGKVTLTIPPGTVGSSMPDRPNAIRHYSGKRTGECAQEQF